MKSSKQCIAALAAALCLLLCVGIAGADGTIYGPSGLVLNPTADIAPVGMTQGSLYWFEQDNTANGAQAVDWLTLNAVGGMKPDAEFSIGYNRLDITQPVAMAANDADGLIIGTKFRLSEESLTTPALAVGINHFDASGFYERTGIYACVTKDLSLPQDGNLGVRGTAGVRWADAELITNVAGATISDSDLIPFVGVEALLAPRLNLILELEAEHDFTGVRTNTPFAAMLRFRPTDNLTVNAGILNTGFDERNSLSIGVSYIWERTSWR